MFGLISIWFVLTFNSALLAIDHDFNGGAVTSTTGVTSQPASLAFIRRQKQFSASVTSFEKTDFDFPELSSIEEDRPLSMRPVSVGSAFSTTYGGWSLLVFNTPFEFRAEQIISEVSLNSSSDFAILGESVVGLFSTGWKIGDNWGLGGSLLFSQTQTSSSTSSYVQNSSNEIFTISETREQSQQFQIAIGSLYVLDEFALGLRWISKPTIISSQGRSRIRATQTALPTGAPSFTDVRTRTKPELTIPHIIESGVRFGRSGFSYLLSHTYELTGLQTANLAFEYVGSWGTITTAVMASGVEKNTQRGWSFGFIKDHENFKWGVGPYFREVKGENSGDISVKTWGLLYSSEIRY